MSEPIKWESACGRVTLYCGDSREILPKLTVDAIVSDPPYGIGYQHGGGGGDGLRCIGVRPGRNKKPIIGDDVDFDPSWMIEYCKQDMKSKNGAKMQIVLCGANYFSQRIPRAGSWICWDKSCGGGGATTFTDGEFVWMNRRNARCIYRHLWMGCTKAGEACGKKRLGHPSEKPVELMMWLIETARIAIDKLICDPYMGTGTTGEACLRNGRRFVGMELDREYFEIAKERLQVELARQKEWEDGKNASAEPRDPREEER